MAYILSIETSTKVCSVAIHKNGALLSSQKLMQEKSHSELLAVLIADTLKYCSLKLQDLNAIAVAKGPGSYTGLRIGVSTAKGLCYSTDLPLIAINSLEGMASSMVRYNLQGSLLSPMIDARRMEVYCMLFDEGLRVIKDTSSIVFEEQTFMEFSTGKPLLIFGDGADKFEGLIKNQPHVSLISGIKPEAEFLGALAFEKYLNSQFEDLAYFEPFYLKDFRMSKPKEDF